MYFPITSKALVECSWSMCIAMTCFKCTQESSSGFALDKWTNTTHFHIISILHPFICSQTLGLSFYLSRSLLLFLSGMCVGLHVLNSVKSARQSETPLQLLPLLHLLWRLSAHHDIRLRDRQREQRLKSCMVWFLSS